MKYGLPAASVIVVDVTRKLRRNPAVELPMTTGEPLGWTATVASETAVPSAKGLNGSGVRAPVAWLTA